MTKTLFSIAILVLLLPSWALAATAPPSMTSEIEDHAEAAQDSLTSETTDAEILSPAPITEDETEETEEEPKPQPAPKTEEVPPKKAPRMLTAPARLKPSKPKATAKPKHQRDSWYIGFGLGGTEGKIKSGGTWKSPTDHLALDKKSGGLAFDTLEVGATISPQLLVGGRFTSGTWGGEEEGTDRSVSHGALYANVTWFPLNDGKGLLMRGGFGFATLTENSTLQTPEGKFSSSEEYNGAGATFGLGYAFWLGDSFNLTLNMDFHYGSFNGNGEKGEPTAAWYNAGTIGFMWY